MNNSTQLSNAEKHIALDIMETNFDSIPFLYRGPLIKALKANLAVKEEIADWLWENNPQITVKSGEMKVNVSDNKALDNLVQMLIDLTNELDERK